MKIKVAILATAATLSAVAAELHLRPGESAVIAEEGWRAKADVWLDAQSAASFTSLTNVWFDTWHRNENSAGYSLLTDDQQIEWRDVRGNGVYARTDKCDSNSGTDFDTASREAYAKAFPRRMQQDGLPSLTFPSNDKARMRLYRDGSTISTNILTGVMVVNASLGGGYSLLYDSNQYLIRVSPLAEPFPDRTAPILANSNGSLSMRLDGAAIEPTTAGYADGWQIVSFKCAGVSKPCNVGGLGQAKGLDKPTYNGGQIYGEIILFSSLLSDDEIQHVEAYLAKKWNIGIAHDTQDYPAAASIFGEGTVTLACDAAATNGVFGGTIDLAGHRLDLTAAAFPFSEATVPSDGRVLWFDPSLPGAVTFGDTPGRTDEIAALAQRDNNGILTGDGIFYTTSPTSIDGTSANYRTRLESGERAGALGVATNWIVFSEKGYTGSGRDSDGQDNALLLLQGGESMPVNLTKFPTVPDIKAGFFALDTVWGGGSQLLSLSGGGGSNGFAKRAERKAAPIWPDNSSANVLAASVYLDGVQVDGFTKGYNYRPEVMSFNIPENENGSPVKQFGYVGYNSGTREIMGEWLLYNKTLDADTRGAIEAYLMNKWLGKLPAGYADFRSASVTGAGVVAVEGPEFLPELAAGFAGTVEFSRTVWNFTLGNDVNAVGEGVDLSGHILSLPPAVTLNFSTRGSVPGLHPIFKCDSFATETEFTVGMVDGREKISIVTAGGVVYAKCDKPGIKIIVR